MAMAALVLAPTPGAMGMMATQVKAMEGEASSL